jgi:hypothetical protein
MMFHGVLPRDDPAPDERTAHRAAGRGNLWVLLLMLAALAVFAGVQFPEAFSSSAPPF